MRVIHGYFVKTPSALIIEIALAAFLDISGTPKLDLESVAPEIFDRLEWLPNSPR